MERQMVNFPVDPQCPVKLFSRKFMKDPYPMLESMRETAAAVPVQDGGTRLWILTRYEDVRRILNGREFCKDMAAHRRELFADNVIDPTKAPRIIFATRRSVLDRDGQDHRRLRSVLNPYFNDEAVNQLRPRIEASTESLIDRLPVGETVDLVWHFARPLIATIIAECLGIPTEYVRDLTVWESRLITGSGVAEIEAAGRWFEKFGREMLAVKRREPADDIYTTLVRQYDQDPRLMNEEELLSTFIVLAIAGSEPASALTNCLSVLLSNLDQFDLLRADPGLMDAAIEECLRLESPFRMLPPRFTDEAIEINGVTLPPRSLLVGSVAAANRDPRQFPNPDQFDLTRPPGRHLSFSYGPHNCLGAGLGRLEVKVALQLLINRFPGMRLAVPSDDLQWRPGMYIRRLDRLPVILK